MTNLTEETFENLLKMLCSEDEENQIVGLGCIEQLDFEKNLLYIILLRKLSWVSTAMWQREAPFANARLMELCPTSIPLMPYEHILDIAKKYPEIDRNSIKMLMKHLCVLLEKKLYGFDPELIKELKILIEFKDDN